MSESTDGGVAVLLRSVYHTTARSVARQEADDAPSGLCCIFVVLWGYGVSTFVAFFVLFCLICVACVNGSAATSLTNRRHEGHLVAQKARPRAGDAGKPGPRRAVPGEQANLAMKTAVAVECFCVAA